MVQVPGCWRCASDGSVTRMLLTLPHAIVTPVSKRSSVDRNKGGTMSLFRLAIVLTLVACASAPKPQQRAAVPEDLRVPDGQSLLLRVAARGVQIYTCKAKTADAAAFGWALKAPEAELFDATGAKFGRHYGGPTWESADGSPGGGEGGQGSPGQGAG